MELLGALVGKPQHLQASSKCWAPRNDDNDDDSDSRTDRIEELQRRFERLGTHKAGAIADSVGRFLLIFIKIDLVRIQKYIH